MPIRGMKGLSVEEVRNFHQTRLDIQRQKIDPTYKPKENRSEEGDDDRLHCGFYHSDDTDTDDEDREAKETADEDEIHDTGMTQQEFELALEESLHKHRDIFGQIIRKAELSHRDVFEEGGADVIPWTEGEDFRTEAFVEDADGAWLVWKERGRNGKLRRVYELLTPEQMARWEQQRRNEQAYTRGQADQQIQENDEHVVDHVESMESIGKRARMSRNNISRRADQQAEEIKDEMLQSSTSYKAKLEGAVWIPEASLHKKGAAHDF